MMPGHSVDVCICTYQRENLISTLESIAVQDLSEDVFLRIIVADNDQQPSAAAIVAGFVEKATIPVQYVHAPSRNISIARNACLDLATADWLAFIDDDEIAAPDWLALLLRKAETQTLTAVFGPSHARYDENTPEWMRKKGFHSNHPKTRNGIVETGHTCNALVRRTDPAVVNERFLISKGVTGGEDTEYFFRIGRKGGRFGICEQAIVYENVDSVRLSFRWLAQRKFRYGQSYGYHGAEKSSLTRARITVLAALKVPFCLIAALLFCWSAAERNFWVLRAVFHAGVVASVFGVSEKELY